MTIVDYCLGLSSVCRRLLKTPGFSFIILLTVAAGIGASSSIFLLAYAVLFRHLPIRAPERLVQLQVETSRSGEVNFLPLGLYDELRREPELFEGLCAWTSLTFLGEVGRESGYIPASKATSDCFSTLGLRPSLGRMLRLDDEKDDSRAAVISYEWWTSRFQRDPAVIGKQLVLKDFMSRPTPVFIVGVLPPEFRSLQIGTAPSIITLAEVKHDNFDELYLIFGRLKERLSVQQTQLRVSKPFNTWLGSLYGDSRPHWAQLNQQNRLNLTLSPGGFSPLGKTYKSHLMLLECVTIILLLASCAYLTNLLAARAFAKQSEVAVKLAFGASRSRLVREILLEIGVLCTIGGCASVFLAGMGSRFLLSFIVFGQDKYGISLSPSIPSLLFTLTLTAAVASLCALLPAFIITRTSINGTLRKGYSTASRSKGQASFSFFFITIQTAAIVFTAALSAQCLLSLVKQISQDNGFRLTGVLFTTTDLPVIVGDREGKEVVSRALLYKLILERLNHSPEIISASVDIVHVLGRGSYVDRFESVQTGLNRGIGLDALVNTIGPRYFSSLGSRIIQGHEFADSDSSTSQPVCILNKSAAAALFPRGQAIGQMLYSLPQSDGARSLQIIGIVEDSQYFDFRGQTPRLVYLNYLQAKTNLPMEFVMRTSNSQHAIATLRRTLKEVSPGVHIVDSISMEELAKRSLAPDILMAGLTIYFASVAVFLGCLAHYALLTFSVTLRNSEIGLRLAMGATRLNIVWIFLSEDLIRILPGIVLGEIVVIGSTPFVSSLLYQTANARIRICVMCAILPLCTMLLATCIPVRRAASINPAKVLRVE